MRASSSAGAPVATTPMMQQYLSIKRDPQYAGAVVLFQLGNFLECFYEDAAICSRVLGIALTTRGNNAGADGAPVPMAGVPLHARDSYISKLVKAGHRVVVVEQQEGSSSSNAPGDAPDPNTATGSRFKRRSTGLARMGTTTGLTASNSGGDSAATSASNATGGGLMRRRVVEIVTRGTATDDSLLTPRSRNLIAAISFLPAADAADGSGGVEAGIAWVDVSTGDFFTARCPVISISAELAVNPPVELLVPSFLKTATTLNSAGSSASNSSAATGTEAIGIEQLQQRLHSSKTGRNASANASRPQDPLLQRIGEAISASSSIPLGSSSSSSPSSAMVIDLPGSSGSEVEPLSLTVLHGSLFSAALGRALIDQAAAASTATATAASAGSSQQPSLSSSSSLSAPELSAASGLLSYVSWTQQGRMPVLRPPTSLSSSPSSAQQQQSQAPMQAAAAMAGTSDQSPQVPLLTRLLASSSSSAPQRMVIDPSTRRSLEITRPINGRRRARGSLLHTLDLCVTAVGSRLLDQRLCSPLLHAPLLNHRLDAVQALYTNDNLREALRKCLNAVPDIERSLHRVAMRRGGAPALLRDLLLVRDGLAAAVRVGAMMASGDHVSFCIDGKASSASSLAGLNKRATGSEVTTEGETIAEEGPDKGATEASGSIAAPASENSATPASSSAVTTSSSGSNRKAGYIIGATNFNASLGFGFTTPGFAFGAANGVGDILGPLSAPASAADRSDAFGKNKPPVSDGTTAAATKELKPLRSAYERAVDNAIAPLLADVNEWASDKPRASTCVAPAAVSSLVELGCRHDFDVTVTNGSAAGIKISSRKGVGDSAVLALASACALLPYASTDASIAAVYRDLIAALDPPLPSALVSLHGVGPGTSSFGDAPEAVGVSVPSNGTSNNSNNNASGIRIRAGYSADLDAARALRDSAHTALAALQDKLRAATGIKNLKVRLTEEQGCVAEVPTAAADGLERAQMQQPEQTGTGGGGKDDNRGSFFPFRRLKTLKATVRYTCPALHQLDRDIREASYRADYQENAILAALCTKVTAAAQEIASVARAVAVIDVSAGLAEAAKRYSLKRPEFVASDDTAAASTSSLELRSLRHLVVERSLMESWVHRATGMAHQMQLQASGATSQAAADEGKAATTDSSDETETQATAPLDADGFESRDLPDDPAPPAAFVPNDCLLGLQPPSPSKSTGSKALSGDAFSEALQASAHVSILTGSNMAGKSTWLRSVAHAVILAQMGAYVPADVARFSLVDKLFARVGASDDVSRGRSTFLVEAEETANILTSATSSSLCLVDEIGRGTSSVDGLAIAYSVLEHLMHSIRCRTLFATHIHELAGMALIAEAKRLGKGCGAKVGIGIDGDYSRPFIQCRGMEAVDDVLLHRELEEQQQEDNQGFSGPSIPHLTHRLAPHPLVGFIREQLASGAPMPAIEDAVWKKASSLSSYGVAVAARAGMPAPVLRRASQISKCLEESAATQAWGKQLSKLL